MREDNGGPEMLCKSEGGRVAVQRMMDVLNGREEMMARVSGAKSGPAD